MTLKRKELIDKISAHGFPENEVVLTLEEFFEGNKFDESIGVNLDPQPTPETFYNILKKLYETGKVDKILVRVSDIEDCEDWVFSDTIYILGLISKKELKDIIRKLKPDEIIEGWLNGAPINIDIGDKNKTVLSIFWD